MLVVVVVVCADFAVFEQQQGSVSSMLQAVAKDEDMSWARREQQALGTVPSRGGGRNCVHFAILNNRFFMRKLSCFLFIIQHRLPSLVVPAPVQLGIV